MKAITVNNLIKNYKNVNAVNSISFEINEGELFAFLGENGAGKSTTINILCTILKKTSGDVKIFDYELDKDDNEIRNSIGIVFQNSVLDFKLTVEENLISRASYYGLNRKKALEVIKPFFEMFELEDIWKRKYENLSGGQRRRVDIVRALINKPRILFLDEPTTGLDPKSRSIVWKYINKLRLEQKITIFLTTHYMEEVVDADRVVILDKGNIVANDTPANLKSKYANTKLYWYTVQNKANNKLISNYEYKYEVDHYIVDMNSEEIRTFIYENQITDFEVFKGSMDDVFLKLTGKELM
ncbi:MAG: ABC transporter ATP-binding protein [Erysipelotrichaceae bacterium]|nr:ABC transporter ATP-binding protein [Erysipelotrichaceae bacterium]